MATTTNERPPGPPADLGRRLGTCSRTARGTGEELRVVIDRYDGRIMAALRMWRQDRATGAWWPVAGKGVALRIKEVPAVVAALQEAARLAAEHADDPAALGILDRAKRPQADPAAITRRERAEIALAVEGRRAARAAGQRPPRQIAEVAHPPNKV